MFDNDLSAISNLLNLYIRNTRTRIWRVGFSYKQYYFMPRDNINIHMYLITKKFIKQKKLEVDIFWCT